MKSSLLLSLTGIMLLSMVNTSAYPVPVENGLAKGDVMDWRNEATRIRSPHIIGMRDIHETIEHTHLVLFDDCVQSLYPRGPPLQGKTSTHHSSSDSEEGEYLSDSDDALDNTHTLHLHNKTPPHEPRDSEGEHSASSLGSNSPPPSPLPEAFEVPPAPDLPALGSASKEHTSPASGVSNVDVSSSHGFGSTTATASSQSNSSSDSASRTAPIDKTNQQMHAALLHMERVTGRSRVSSGGITKPKTNPPITQKAPGKPDRLLKYALKSEQAKKDSEGDIVMHDI